jgi:hypothetical protein
MPLTHRMAGGAVAGALLLAGCGLVPQPGASPSPTPVVEPWQEAQPGAAATPRTPTATVDPVPQHPTPNAASRTSAPSLVGDTSNAWAFARLDQPAPIVVEGEVPSQRAWSTSKVLVIAAFLAEAVDGDPDRATATQRRQMERALTESDMDSLVAIANAIPGGKSAGMTKVLRSIGDSRTTVPSRLEGTMTWSVEEQVRFLIALNDGRVVSRKASQYLVANMRPIESQSWGLGSIDATAYKGGWLRANTETRQMGIVDGYAVAIITRGVGPAEVQSDGDSAHVQQLNLLAGQLRQRLAAEG